MSFSPQAWKTFGNNCLKNNFLIDANVQFYLALCFQSTLIFGIIWHHTNSNCLVQSSDSGHVCWTNLEWLSKHNLRFSYQYAIIPEGSFCLKIRIGSIFHMLSSNWWTLKIALKLSDRWRQLSHSELVVFTFEKGHTRLSSQKWMEHLLCSPPDTS